LAAGWLGDPSHTMLAHCFSIGMYGSVDFWVPTGILLRC
jgi:hypothetical protein